MLESPDMASLARAGQPIYLASNSPRRRELLSLTGLPYSLLAAPVDETPRPGEAAAGYVRRIATHKAMAASARAAESGLVVAADTAVVDRAGDGALKILGKPSDTKDAVAMLQSLRGHTHQVFTALALLPLEGGTILSDLCATLVPMRAYSDAEIDAYVATGDPLDKAGAYAIQHAGFHPVSHLQGCYANVMGLPLCHLVRSLLSFGVIPTVEVPRACQAALGYACPVYRQVLDGNLSHLALSHCSEERV